MSHERSTQGGGGTGVREWFGRHPGIAMGGAITLVLVSIAFIAVQVMASRKRYPEHLPTAYYTVDDGKSYFEAGMENVPPFDWKGQTAVRAYVFQCGTGKPFVGYVERYNAEAHKAMVENRAMPQHQITGRELKRPGETAWAKSADRKASAAVADVRCPDGGSQIEPIEP